MLYFSWFWSCFIAVAVSNGTAVLYLVALAEGVQRAMGIPLYHSLTDDEAEDVIRAVKK